MVIKKHITNASGAPWGVMLSLSTQTSCRSVRPVGVSVTHSEGKIKLYQIIRELQKTEGMTEAQNSYYFTDSRTKCSKWIISNNECRAETLSIHSELALGGTTGKWPTGN